MPPREHGIVGNGWYFRDTQEIRFWQQANSLIQAKPFYDEFETAKMFWWFNQSSSADTARHPNRTTAAMAPRCLTSSITTDVSWSRKLDRFRSSASGVHNAGLPASRWIAEATAIVLKQKQPQLTLAYLPHLDYDFQRLPVQDPARSEKLIAA